MHGGESPFCGAFARLYARTIMKYVIISLAAAMLLLGIGITAVAETAGPTNEMAFVCRPATSDEKDLAQENDRSILTCKPYKTRGSWLWMLR